MSILEDIAAGASALANFGFSVRQQQVELAATKSRADAEKAAAQAELLRQQSQKDNVYKFARIAFFVAMGLAGLAVLNEARKLWKGK